MTLTRRRVRVSKYIAQVNHMGTDMGTKFMLLYFIYIKQLLNAIKWRCCQTYELRHQFKFISKKLGTNQWDVKFV